MVALQSLTVGDAPGNFSVSIQILTQYTLTSGAATSVVYYCTNISVGRFSAPGTSGEASLSSPQSWYRCRLPKAC